MYIFKLQEKNIASGVYDSYSHFDVDPSETQSGGLLKNKTGISQDSRVYVTLPCRTHDWTNDVDL